MDKLTGALLGFLAVASLVIGGLFAYEAYKNGSMVGCVVIAIIALILTCVFGSKGNSYATRCPKCRQFNAISTQVIGQQDGAVTHKKDSQGKYREYVRVTYHKLDSCAYCDYQHDYYETKEEEA